MAFVRQSCLQGTGHKTRRGEVARPSTTETFTQQDTPSFLGARTLKRSQPLCGVARTIGEAKLSTRPLQSASEAQSNMARRTLTKCRQAGKSPETTEPSLPTLRRLRRIRLERGLPHTQRHKALQQQQAGNARHHRQPEEDLPAHSLH